MSTGSARSPSGDDLQFPGGFVLVRRLRGDATAGCGAVEDSGGRAHFARWGASAGASASNPDVKREAPTAAENEHRVLTSLASVGVPAAVDLLRGDGRCVSISTWIEGDPASAAGRLDDVDLERAAVQLVSILARAHWCGWVHGDIKPANVIIGPDGSVHLIDWAGACRIGEQAPPGTLGFAPPWAWCENHKAEPRDDYYALATTLRELRHGRRVTVGARADVLDRQREIEFTDATDALPTVARLFACAAAGTDLASAGLAYDSTRGLGVRAEAVESRLIRRAVVGAARQVGASVAARTESTIESSLPIDARDLPCAASALAVELRIEHRLNALRWPDLIARLAPPPSEAFQDSSATRVDRMRDRSAFVESEARRVLSTIDNPVIVVCASDVSSTDAPVWSQLRGASAASNDGARSPWTLVLLDAASVPIDASSVPMDRSRAVLDEVFGGTPLADRLAVVASSRWSGSIRESVEGALSLATSGRLVLANGLLDVGESDTSIGPASFPKIVVPSNPSRELDLCEDDPVKLRTAVEASLSAGEAAALQGKLSDTIRACIRVNSYLHVLPAQGIEVALRLADLWSECGRADAAEIVLRGASNRNASVEVSLRLARIAASRGDVDQLASLLIELRSREVPRTCAADLARLSAMAHMLRRDFTGAQAVLLRALKDRASVTLRGRMWLLTTLGNVLRLRGRPFSARRVLRYVKLHATQAGGARLQIAAAGNLLIASAGDAPPSRMASEAAALASRCFSWGMIQDGLVNSLTAATYWIGLGESGSARQHSSEALRLHAASDSRMNATASALCRIQLAAIDIDEDWVGVRTAIESIDPSPVRHARSMHVGLIREELGLSAFDSLAPGASVQDLTRDARVVSLLTRLVTHHRSTLRRMAIALRQLELTVDGWLPVIGHAARMTVRKVRRPAALFDLLEVARAEFMAREAAQPIAVALHAAALAWASTVPRDAAVWFAANAPGDERRRPAGIRLWEWRLAVHRAAIESGAAEHDDQDAEAVLAEMESTVRRLWADARSGYARSLPLGNVARLSGCEVADEELRTTSDDPAAPFERIRSILFRRRVSEERGGKRAAGLERVLRGALRLQSATDIDGLLGEIVAGVAAVCRAERAVVVYGGGRRQGRAKVAAGGAVSSIAQSEAEVSLTAVARVRETKRACLIDDACGDERLGDRPSVMQFRPRSLIVAPLQTLGEFLGYIYVENRSAAKSFNSSDVELVEGFAAQAAFALENAQLVDELRRSCEELDRARSDAVRAESLRVVGRMASEVAHDFNNLLTAILGETRLLMQVDDVRNHAESLAVIERAALDGADVVRRMQATTRIKDPSAFVVLSLKDLVRNVLDMMRWRATSERVDVHCDVDAGLRVRGVPSELREVLTNLVVNALDAMSGGGELRIVGAQSGRDAVLDVDDTGHGMDARTAAQAFDPFFSTKGEKGNGLGLSIAYGIMQRHGGDIQVASRVGSGTRMRVTIPLASESSDASVEAADEHVRPRRQPSRALVVDDEPAIARVLSTMLRRSGVDVEVSIGGRAGLASLRAKDAEFDLVITDVNMPDVNGIEVAMTALETAQPAQVVLMSGSLGGREEATAQALGVQVLRKPFTVKDIDRLVLGVS